LVEKVITLENVSLVDFLGVENRNINELSSAFPKSKIISRGNEIRIKGSTPEIIRINQIVHSLVTHYHKFGKITEESVKTYLNEEHEESQKKLIALLESHKIEVCPLPMRHQRTLGGGFHCVSLDLNRKGSLESYFS
jgi:phosphate starvation-inducible protein PhoH